MVYRSLGPNYHLYILHVLPQFRGATIRMIKNEFT